MNNEYEMYVIKFNDKYYYERGLMVTTSIYEATIFTHKEIARNILKVCIANYEKIKGWEYPDDGIDNFKIVKVELKEV